jgi:hypothetical protein
MDRVGPLLFADKESEEAGLKNPNYQSVEEVEHDGG